MKKISRRIMLRKRNRLSPEEIIKMSKAIRKNLFNSLKKASTVMFYVSFGSEVYTHDMIKAVLKKKKVCVPVLKGDKIIAAMIKDFKDLDKKNKYGILEPSKIKKVDKKKIDAVIVPGVVFDKNNHRIGYGKGCYDDFLRDFKGEKIGLCFDFQHLESIPWYEWDVTLSKVISEI